MVSKLLLRLEILSWDSHAAENYSVLHAALENIGNQLSILETMIAAHALAVKEVLVTNDNAFSRVKGLKIEDWLK